MATNINSKTFEVQVRKYIESNCKKAVEETTKIAQEKLKEYVEEQYYHDPGFYPNIYERTEEFLNHAIYEMLSSNSARIFIDIDGMHYKNNFSPWQVVSWASESKHGAEYYQTSTPDFWTVFIAWCNNNLIDILISNLKKYDVNVSKRR